MNIKNYLENWISAGNRYQTENYLKFYLPDAVLTDPSVGQEFIGVEGIKEYFISYFIGYKTQTKIVSVDIKGEDHAFVLVEFTGEFPQKKLGGTFDMQFKNGKISKVTADLI